MNSSGLGWNRKDKMFTLGFSSSWQLASKQAACVTHNFPAVDICCRGRGQTATLANLPYTHYAIIADCLPAASYCLPISMGNLALCGLGQRRK